MKAPHSSFRCSVCWYFSGSSTRMRYICISAPKKYHLLCSSEMLVHFVARSRAQRSCHLQKSHPQPVLILPLLEMQDQSGIFTQMNIGSCHLYAKSILKLDCFLSSFRYGLLSHCKNCMQRAHIAPFSQSGRHLHGFAYTKYETDTIRSGIPFIKLVNYWECSCLVVSTRVLIMYEFASIVERSLSSRSTGRDLWHL